MSINLISDTIDELVQQQPTSFSTHSLVSNLIKYHNHEWRQFVNEYSGNRLVQEQKAVQQIGRYLGRNANCLSIRQGRKITSTAIESLVGHNPQSTTEWLK
jgi:hypothetical protein